MGWRKADHEPQPVEEILDTIRQMHDEQDAGPLPGTEDSK